MKNLFKFIYPFSLCLILALSFSSCSDDDDKSSEALILEMTFDNPIVTQQPVIDGMNIKFSVAYNATNEVLKELIPTIKVSPKASVDPKSGSKVDFSGESVIFTVTAEDGTTQVYSVTCTKNSNTEALILNMTFDSPVVIQQPIITGANISFYVKGNVKDADLSKLIPIIRISDNATIDIEPETEIDFSKGSVQITVTAEDGVTKTIYAVECIKSTAEESSILKMTFDNPIIIEQPVINGKSILFHVADNATLKDLQELIPTIELSDKATINLISGSKVDFSKGYVDFIVTAGNGKSKTTYKASLWRNKHNFEEWYEQGTASHTANNIKLKYYAPTGFWSSSNVGASFLIMFGQSKEVVVTKTDDAHSGTGAARIETIQSNKLDGTGGALYPVVTTGSLFLGEFKTDIFNTLNSTKFGIPYNKKPLTVKGYYKYTPGAEFLRCPDPKSYNKVNVEAGTKDECAINAILYEISSDNDPYITGVDTYNKEKLTAIAQLEDGTAKANYTAFSIDMKYEKPYDPTKKYRFAIICSSSKSGDTFSGAPGSVLYVDDIEVISE